MSSDMIGDIKKLKGDTPEKLRIPGPELLSNEIRVLSNSCLKGLVRDLNYIYLSEDFSYNPDNLSKKVMLGRLVNSILVSLSEIISLALDFGMDLESFWDDFIKLCEESKSLGLRIVPRDSDLEEEIDKQLTKEK